MRSILLLFTVLYSSLLVAQKPFVHPGILLTAADLTHLKAVADDHRMPEYGSYELLRDLPLSSADYKLKGPFRVISRDGDYSYTKSSFEQDFSSVWLNTLLWAATGDSAHAQRALAILGAYADSLTTIPNTNDAPLLAGLEGLKIINAMELLRYTYKNIPASTTKKINRMILGIFLPVCKKFYDTPAYTNGNWGPIVTKTYMSAAIYFNNRAMYKKAVDFFYNAHDNGTICNYISATTGQIQESGRDQGHSQLGLGALATVCQIAWNQGNDLYSAYDNRLLKGFEYVAKYNLGSDDIPFTTWKDITGKYSDWTVISPKSRGHFIPIYEMVYNHYVRLKGLAMPYTSQVIEKIRPEGYDRDQPGFGTLLYHTPPTVSLSSPDGKLNVVFRQSEVAPDKRQMSYHVDHNGKPVIAESALDIRLDNRLSEEAMGLPIDQHTDWCENLRITHIDYYHRDTTWHPLYGERSSIPDRYNAAVIHLMKDDNPIYTMDVELRCYNEGIALRYYFPENPKGTYYRITSENTEFQLPADTKAWYTNWAQGPYSLLPLKAWPGETERPLTLQLPDSLYVCLTEAGMVDYSRTKFKLSDQKENTIVTSMYGPADLISPVGTPWRLILVGERPGDLIEHDYLVEDLNPRNKIADSSWIVPGKQMRLMTQTPQAAFANIDFLVKHHMQYLLLDWKWYGPAYSFASDATRPEPSVDLPAILRYAKQKDIGVWLYANMQALYAQSDSLFRVYHDWGVVGVKFGFVQAGSHRWTTWLEDMFQKTAQNKLMVDVHDDWRPTGEQRTWPNLLTAEGVRGNEEMPDATHNTVLPFTRFIAGGADYTLCYYSPRIRTTHAHQLAMAAVYYSPLQTLYWYDAPDDSHDEPELEFWDAIPTTWDETRVLQGYPGEYVTIARRKGEQWFVGTLNNTRARELPTGLGFLPPGKTFEATIYSDDPSIPTATHVRIDHRSVDSHTVLHPKLLASGGQAIWIRPSARQPQRSTPVASRAIPDPTAPRAIPTREPSAPVWQWSVPVTGGKANPHARAWLWIPPTCRTVKTVILTQNNMEELSIVENARFREKMAALGVAEVWVSPMFDHRFLFTEGAGDVFSKMMQDLADSSGYPEIATAPVIGIGHSAAASWPYYLAAWAPERTLACISVSGQWPYFRDKRFAFDIWSKDQNIDFIPSLETMGEYEAADTWSAEGLKERQAHPAMPLSMLACPAEGHFAATQKKIDYLAFWISKAMYYRLPRRAGQPLRPVDPRHTGWLMERWQQNQISTAAPSSAQTPSPAPVGSYKGDPAQAFWFFDRETVDSTRKYESAYRSMKTPLLGYIQKGDTVKQQNTHLQVELPWQPEADGIKFILHPAFLDTVPGESPRPAMWTGLPVGARAPHPDDASKIAITRVVGPFRQIDDTLFELSLQKETPAFLAALDTAFVDTHRPLVFTFIATSPGNAIFKPAVQQAEMAAPAVNTQGTPQTITFDSIGDRTARQPIRLHATSDAGLQVHFTVIDGPAIIKDDTLYLTPVPPKARYPVRVTVAAWQYGCSAEPKVESAPVIIRRFRITAVSTVSRSRRPSSAASSSAIR